MTNSFEGSPDSSAPIASRLTLLGLVLLLLFTFGKGILWAALIAPLDAPDEPSHFNYVVQVREGYLLPVVDLVSPGGLKTPPSTPLNQDVRDYFAAHGFKFFMSMPYESAQPPLYYWAAALWTRPINIAPANLSTMLLAIRIFSALLGTGAVFALWLACRWTIGNTWLAWAAPLALTLNPEFSFTTASVSNDAGVLFWGAALLAVWACGLYLLKPSDEQQPIQVIFATIFLAALVTGAGILTKLTFVATIPGSLLWLYWLSPALRIATTTRAARLRTWAVSSIGFLAIPALIVFPWALRNLREYGEPTGARAIFNLIHGIYWQRLNFPADQLFSQFPLDDFAVRSFRSFWALFGWASVWLDDKVYLLLAVFVVLAITGLLLGRKVNAIQHPTGMLAILAAVTCLLAFANYVAYNSLVEFQPHIRYTFVSLAPAMLLLVLGMSRIPWTAWRVPLVATFMVILAGVHLLSLSVLWQHTQTVLAATSK